MKLFIVALAGSAATRPSTRSFLKRHLGQDAETGTYWGINIIYRYWLSPFIQVFVDNISETPVFKYFILLALAP